MQAPDERRRAGLPQIVGAALLPREVVDAHREEIIAILAGHRMMNARLFGSVARRQDHPGSDVDLLVDAADDLDFLDLVDAAEPLEHVLGVRVDITTSRSLREGHEIERTAVPL